jgi:hypothetical protein
MKSAIVKEIKRILEKNNTNLVKEVQLIKEKKSKLLFSQRKLLTDNYKPVLREMYMRKNSLAMYAANRDLFQTGDIIEFSSSGVIGKIIRLFTKKKVNHSSMVVRLAFHKSITEPHIYIMEANPRGVEFNLLSRVLEKHDGSAWWLRLNPSAVRGKLPGVTFDDVWQQIADFLVEQEGLKYDYKSLFKNAFGKVSVDAAKYFCSELCCAALAKVNLFHTVKSLTPGAFEKTGLYEIPNKII